MLFLLLGPLASASDHYIPFATSPPFPVDTRRVAPQSEGTSGVFIADTRALDGVIGFAVSGDAGIHTGGYSMGVPLVTGILPQVVPGIDGRQWITLTGFHFLSGARVVLRTGIETFTIPPERTQVLSDTSIRVFVNVTSAPAEWTAQVTNPGGLPSPPLAFAVGGAAVSPASAVDFGTLTLNTHAERTFTLRNTGDSEIAWSSAAGGFFSILGPASGTLAPGANIALTLRYTPTTPGPHATTARFNLGGQIHQRELSGRGSAGEQLPDGRVWGVVMVDGPNGEVPAANSEIRFAPVGNLANSVGLVGRTDSQGMFEFDIVPDGGYQIFVNSGQVANSTPAFLPIPITVPNSDAIRVTIPYLATPISGSKDEPVVLVRGIGRNDDNEDGYWKNVRKALQLDGYAVWDPNEWRPDWSGVNNSDTTLLGEEDFDVNSSRLLSFIIEKSTQYKSDFGTDVPGINIVAHSMGGLTVRSMLAKPDLTNQLPAVKRVVMLSTPHAGSHLSDFSEEVPPSFREKKWRLNWKSTRSLTTSNMLSLRPLKWPSYNPPKLFLAGGNRGEPDFELIATNRYIMLTNSSYPIKTVNDGAVTLLSAAGSDLMFKNNVLSLMAPIPGLNRTTPLKYVFEEADPARGILSSNFRVFNLNHYDIKSDGEVVNWIRQVLEDRLSSTSRTSRSPRNDPPPPDEAEPFSGLAVDQRSFSVAPGATELATLPLTGIGKARWLVSLSDREVAVRLQRPLGVGWISGAGPGVTWEVVDEEDGDGRWIEITLDDPEAGLWGIEFHGAGVAAEAEVAVSVMEEGGPTFEAASGGLVAAGAAVPMLAAASWDNGLTTVPVPGGTVEATVIAPDGTESLRVLPDDGLNGDGAAGDGIHGLLAEEFADPGIYDVLLRYQGTHPDTGAAFRRLARGSFTRSADGGFIAGIEGHRTVDADGDGYPEAVILDVRVDNLDPGNFTLAGTLAEADGDGSFQGVTEFHRAEAGAGIVNLVFDKHNLPMGRESGPFEIRELRLIRAEGELEWLHDHPPGYAVQTTMFNSYSRFLRVSGEFDFGWVKAGESATRTLRIHNDGWGPMIVGNPELPAGFTGSFEGEIPAGGFQDVEITFSPLAAASYGGAFAIPSNANAGTVEAVWSGTGYDGILLADWLVEKGVPEADRDPLADPDGDGIPNLLAYLFNIAPIGNDAGDRASALPTPRLGEDGAGRYLALRYRHHMDAERLTVTLEACEDLEAESWQAITPDAIIDLAPDPATGDPIREFRVRIGDEPKRFVRMAVREQG